MKKFLLLAAMIAVTTAAYALSFTVDNINYTDHYNYEGANGNVPVKDGAVVVDPSPNASGYLDFSNGVEYGGVHYNVIGFNRNAFYNNKNITGLKADSKLALFGDNCFKDSGLAGTLELDGSGMIICKNAFDGTQIEKLVINGTTNRQINNYAFANCPNLSEVELNGNYIQMGSDMFSGDTKLITLRYPANEDPLSYTTSIHTVSSTTLRGSSISTLILPSTIHVISGISGIPLENLIIEGDEEPLEIEGPIQSTAGDFTITINRANPPTFTNFGKTIQYVFPTREVTYNTEYFFPVQPSVILEGAAAENAAAYQSAQGWEELADHITTGVYNIAVEPVEAIEAPVYYNLNGMRCSAEALTPGVYVKVVGTAATKILVR